MRVKLSAGLLTLVVLAILILSGPANAFVLSVGVLHPTVYVGGKITFSISADTENDETKIDYVILDLIGSRNYTCKFDINGTVINGCSGMNITKLSERYSYGYGYNALESVKFKIDMNTSGYNSGKYNTFARVINDEKISSRQGAGINLKLSRKGIIDCSVRGEKGNLVVDEFDFGSNNRINFYIPLENAVRGTGYLTGQNGKNRFSYNFKVLEVLNNSAGEARILVSGEYKTGLGKDVNEEAVIILIKSGSISVIGDRINLENMKITFKKGC